MNDPKLGPQEYLLRLQCILDRNTLPLSYTLDGWALKWAIDTIVAMKPPEEPVTKPEPHRVDDPQNYSGVTDL